MIKSENFRTKYKSIEILLIFIFFTVLYFFLFFYKNHFLIGRWESGVIYDSFMPTSELLLPSIQIAGDTVGYHGTGYPLLKISKFFSMLFVQDTITIKILPNVYGILTLILFFKIIFEKFGIKVAYCSTGLFLTNYYFQVMHGLLIAPPLTLLLIFFCIDRFNHFDNKKFSSYFLAAVASSLLCMNYIIGRYVLIIIFFYFILDENFSFGKKIKIINFKKVKDLFKIILFMILILTVIYPPNLSILFSKEIFFPTFASGESASFELKDIYQTLIQNLIYIYNLLIVGNYNEINIFDLTFGKIFKISPKIFIFFFLIGIFSSLKQKNYFFFYILFFSIFFMSLMSHVDLNKLRESLPSSTMSSFRVYSMVPFYFLFSSVGILFVTEKVMNYFKMKRSYSFIFITLLILFNALSFIKEKTVFYNYVASINIDFNQSVISKGKSADFQDRLNQIYFLKLSKYVQEKINSENKQYFENKFSFIYLDENYFTPSYYPPGWGGYGGYPRKDEELQPKKNTYYFPMFMSFYLNHHKKVGYLIREKDQYFWWKKISTIITNQEEYEKFIKTKSQTEIIVVILLRTINNLFGNKIFKFTNNDLVNDENKDINKYIIYNPSFFKKLSHVIISDEDQLNFVKANFTNNILYLKK